jgi:hypothetical protein
MRLTLPIMSIVITLNPLLKFSAGQWNTLVNIGLALCGLAGQDCIGTNSLIHSAQQTPQPPASDAQIRVIQGKYGRHCFAIHAKDRSMQTISIMRSVRQCILSVEGPSSSVQPQPTAA